MYGRFARTFQVSTAPENASPPERSGGHDWDSHPHWRHGKVDESDGHPNLPGSNGKKKKDAGGGEWVSAFERSV